MKCAINVQASKNAFRMDSIAKKISENNDFKRKYTA
jgi:hypothetical protein